MSQGPGLDDIFPPLGPENVQAMEGDIAHYAEMAARGDNLPLSVGTICAWWGFLLTVTNFYQAAAYGHWVPGPMPIGIAQILFGYVGTFILMRIEKKGRVLLAWRNQAISAIWLFSGLVICVFMTGSIVTAMNRPVISNVFLSLVFALNFGAMATSRLSGWLIYVAVGWIIGAVLNFVFRGSDFMMSVLFGVLGLAGMMAPGLILRWQEKKAAV